MRDIRNLTYRNWHHNQTKPSCLKGASSYDSYFVNVIVEKSLMESTAGMHQRFPRVTLDRVDLADAENQI